MNTFLKVLILAVLALVVIKLAPLLMIPALIAFLALLVAGVALAGGLTLLLIVTLAVLAVLSPLWLPVLALIGFIALIRRASRQDGLKAGMRVDREVVGRVAARVPHPRFLAVGRIAASSRLETFRLAARASAVLLGVTMAQDLPSAIIAGISFTGRSGGVVKALSGFRKGHHSVPDAANAVTNAFLGKICATELGEQAETLFQKVRTGLGYKRKDLALALTPPSAELTTKDFTVALTTRWKSRIPPATG
jgi:hypothetical protein